MIGELLNNRYSIQSEIGRGGFGVIYRANDTLLEREVAIKVLSPSALGSQGSSRLLREARSTAQLNHPNIVAVYDAGEQGGVAIQYHHPMPSCEQYQNIYHIFLS